MMQPVTGTRDFLQLGLLEMLVQQAGGFGIGKIAFVAPHQKDWDR